MKAVRLLDQDDKGSLRLARALGVRLNRLYKWKVERELWLAKESGVGEESSEGIGT